jgi:hypothetical protein
MGLASSTPALPNTSTGIGARWLQRDGGAANFVAFTLGRWFLYLRVHQALWSDLRTRGLPHRMPVVVGQHDFGSPRFSSVYMSETICDSSDASSRILAQRQTEARALYDQRTEEEVSTLRERRDGIRGWPFFWNRSNAGHSSSIARSARKFS